MNLSKADGLIVLYTFLLRIFLNYIFIVMKNHEYMYYKLNSINFI